MALSDDEIKQLRENLKNPVLVKTMFLEFRKILRDGIRKYQERKPQNTIEEELIKTFISETEFKSYIYNLLELLFLEQLKIKENIELIADYFSKPDNKELLRKLKTNLESG